VPFCSDALISIFICSHSLGSGGVLIIQFTPAKYLVLVEKAYPELKEKYDLARTDFQQMKKDLKEDLISQWYTG